MRDLSVISDGAMLIRDGVIVAIGPTRRLDNLAEARTADEIDATGRIVLPGFIDCFTHAISGPARWEEDQIEAMAASIRALHSWSPQRLDLEGRRRLRQFIRSGTVATAAGCGYGLDEEADFRALRAADRLVTPLLELVPFLCVYSGCWETLGETAIDGLAILERLATVTLPLAISRRLVRGVVVDDGFPRQAIDGLVACAKRLGLLCFVELETGSMGGASAVVDIRSPTDEDIHQLARASLSTVAILLPGRSFQQRSRYAPARRLIDAGASVALATGYDPFLSATPSMPMILSLATTQLGMSAEEAITAATVNAACALGLGDRMGRLECGLPADFVLADCSDYREIPLYFGANPVISVMRGGERVYPSLER